MTQDRSTDLPSAAADDDRQRGRRSAADRPARRHSPPRGAGARIAAAAAASVLLASLSGCALAARVLTTAQVLDAVSEFAEDARRAGDDAPGGSSRHGPPIAAVAGTGGEGLRLNDRPAGDRVHALPDGTVVDVLCRIDGSERDGPFGPTTEWLRVRIPDGRTGYMSSAYLDRPHPAAVVYACSTSGAVG